MIVSQSVEWEGMGKLLFRPQRIRADKLAQSVESAEDRNPVPGSHRLERDDWPPKLPSATAAVNPSRL